MKKFLLISVTLVLVVGLIFGGCAAPAPAPAPEREVMTINLITSPFGSTGYLVAQQLASEVNREHPWLRINVIEGKGNNIHNLANKPEIRSDTIAHGGTLTNWFVKQGWPPAEVAYDGALCLGKYLNPALMVIGSRDANIRSIEDLAGKKVSLFTKGTGGEVTLTAILKHIGIFDTIKPDYLDFEGCADAIIDGTIDAGVNFSKQLSADPPIYQPVPALIRMLESTECYIVDTPVEVMRGATQATGIPITPSKITAGGLYETPYGAVPRVDTTTALTGLLGWWVDKDEFPEEVAYEVVKMYAKYIEPLSKTCSGEATLSVATMATLDIDEDAYHPGALRFYREAGIKVINIAK